MNNENAIEPFCFNVYITGAFKTDEQKDRLKSIGDFIDSLVGKLPEIKLSGYVPGINTEECMKRISQCDLFVVVSDDMDDNSTFQLGYAYSTGLPIVLFTEKPQTRISELIAFTISCFVNNENTLLEVFISQAYEAKKQVYEDMQHINEMGISLQAEITEFKKQEAITVKEQAEQTKVFQMKQLAIEKGTQEAFDKSNANIDELTKYKKQTSFIGTIE